MKRAVLIIGFVLCVGLGQAEAGVFSTIGQGTVWVWNILPGIVRVVNTGVHFICDNVHTALHTTADLLQIDNLP